MAGIDGARRRTLIGLACALAVGAGAPAMTQEKSQLTALAKLEPGLWQLRDLQDSGAGQRSLCVADPAVLMQVHHGKATCTRTVIADEEKAAIVHYTCPANGFGRTSVRVETSKLARIETQGISGSVPFEHRLEARWAGACPTRLGSAR
ncbi:MAG TPA: hypothetical protein VF582_06970 [Allosphingosinicella sp.]|jgi:hypothetical protein